MVNLSGPEGSKKILIMVVLLSIAVFLGQIFEAAGFKLDNLPDAMRLLVDQTQYHVGLMAISFLFIITIIKKSEMAANGLLNSFKYYFIILFMNDFFILLIKMIQKSNIVTLRNGFSGIGTFYVILASIRNLTDLVLTSTAAAVLVWGLVRYKPSQQESAAFKRLGPAIIGLIVFRVAAAIPISLTGILTDRSLFIWSLMLSQTAQIAIAFLVYWVVKEHQQESTTGVFTHLTRYFGLQFLITGLNFTYTIGSFSLLQQFPTGEMQTLGGFGKVVLFISFCSQVALNYFMYHAITSCQETPQAPVSPQEGGTATAITQFHSMAEQSAAGSEG